MAENNWPGTAMAGFRAVYPVILYYHESYFLTKYSETITERYICHDFVAKLVRWLVTVNTIVAKKKAPIS